MFAVEQFFKRNFQRRKGLGGITFLWWLGVVMTNIVYAWVVTPYTVAINMQYAPSLIKTMEHVGVDVNAFFFIVQMFTTTISSFFFTWLIAVGLVGICRYSGFLPRIALRKDWIVALLCAVMVGETAYYAVMLLDIPFIIHSGTIIPSLSLSFMASEPNSEAFIILSKFCLSLVCEVVVLGVGISTLFQCKKWRGILIAVPPSMVFLIWKIPDLLRLMFR